MMNKSFMLGRMWRHPSRGIVTLFSICAGFAGSMVSTQPAQGDIYVYRDTRGTLHITNKTTVRTSRAKAKKVNSLQSNVRRTGLSSQPVRSKVAVLRAENYAAGADIHVYRDEQGILHFTNSPSSPRYRPFLLVRTYASRLRSAKESAEFDRLIQTACQRYGVEFALVKAVIKAESAFDPQALSSAGARGLMQLMPETAALHGVSDIHAPHENIEGGVRHLRLLLDRFNGDLTLALAAYNAGAGAVDRYNGVPPYQETQEYVQRVLRYREDYKQHAALNHSPA
jgi:soluble lytic murein transglycosylase-like protein